MTRCDLDGVPCVIQEIKWDEMYDLMDVYLFDGSRFTMQGDQVIPKISKQPTDKWFQELESWLLTSRIGQLRIRSAMRIHQMLERLI